MNKEFTYQKEGIASDIVEFLVQDYNLDLNTALTTLYESDTFEKLSDPGTGLYFQGSLYVYSYLKKELQTGSIG